MKCHYYYLSTFPHVGNSKQTAAALGLLNCIHYNSSLFTVLIIMYLLYSYVHIQWYVSHTRSHLLNEKAPITQRRYSMVSASFIHPLGLNRTTIAGVVGDL